MDGKPPGKMSDYTRPECEYLRQVCNFTQEEEAVFNLRVRGWSIAHIGIELGMCDRTVARRIQKIKRKIYKVL